MGRLYSQRDEFGYLSSNEQLQRKIHSYQRDMLNPNQQHTHYDLYQRSVSRFFLSVSPLLLKLLKKSHVTQVHDVFFWLICQGNEDMVRHVWARCAMPVHVALLGSAIAKKMAAVLPEPAKTRSRNLAEALEDWAYGLLETANTTNANKILQLQVCEAFIRPNACMDVAMATGAKKFLTQRHCVKLMDVYWRGGIPGSSIEIKQDANMLLLLLYAVLPIFNPYLWKKTKEQKVRAAAAVSKNRSDSIIDALGMVFRVLGDGPGGNKVHEEAMDMLSSAKLARGGEQEMSSRWVADLFGPNAADGDLGEDVAKVMGKVASFYTAPVVKFLVRFLIHLVNLVLYTALINQFVTSGEIDERTSVCKTLYPYPEEGTSLGGQRWDCMMAHEKMPLMSHFQPIEVAWIVFELSFFSDMRHQKTIRSVKRMPSKIGVGQLAYASDVLVVVSFALRCAMEVIAATDYVDDSGEAMQT